METFVLSGFIFLFAGVIKGMVGFGFPLVALVLLTLFIGLHDALPLTILPSVITNIWQAIDGEHFREIVKRMWFYFLVSVITVLLSSFLLVTVNVNWLTALLGLVLLGFALTRFLDYEPTIPAKYEPAASIILAPLNGFITGTTGVYLVPSLLYMRAIGFRRDTLIQAMGIFFTMSSIALAISLQRHELLSMENGLLSLVVLLPAFAGMYLGRHVRKNIDAEKFQLVFDTCLALLGAYLLCRSTWLLLVLG